LGRRKNKPIYKSFLNILSQGGAGFVKQIFGTIRKVMKCWCTESNSSLECTSLNKFSTILFVTVYGMGLYVGKQIEI